MTKTKKLYVNKIDGRKVEMTELAYKNLTPKLYDGKLVKHQGFIPAADSPQSKEAKDIIKQTAKA